MKKTYKNPTLEVVGVESVDILAGSFDSALSNDPVNGSVALGREADFSDWGGDDFVIDDEVVNIEF